MPERFPVYRYDLNGPDDARETRYSLAPLEGTGYGGRDGHTPDGAHEDATKPRPAGHVEAPTGTKVATVEPPVLDIPGRGKVDLHAIIGATGGQASELGHLVSWHPSR